MALSYKVFPGTPYYSNTALTTQAGTIVNTTAATYVNTTYGTVSVGGSTYYVAYGQMISFWNSSFTGQEIDDAVSKVRNPDTAPTANSTNLITSGAVKSAITSLESDLAEIHATGTTNATGATIYAGTWFYLNGVLVRSLVDIADGATFTQGTNYTIVDEGGLNDIDHNWSSISDFNDLRPHGTKRGVVYGVSSSTSGIAANNPLGNTESRAFFAICVGVHDYCSQIAIITSDGTSSLRGRMFVRGCQAGTWSPWKSLAEKYIYKTMSANTSLSFTLGNYSKAVVSSYGYSENAIGRWILCRIGTTMIQKALASASDITFSMDSSGKVTVTTASSTQIEIEPVTGGLITF